MRNIPRKPQDHKVLGKQVLVSVENLDPQNTVTDIVVVINEFGFQFKASTPIWLPLEIVKNLKESTRTVHQLNEETRKPEAVAKKNFAVEKVELTQEEIAKMQEDEKALAGK